MAITQTITAIPKAGKRGIDTRDAFVVKQEAFQDALTDTFVAEINAFRTQANTLETNVNNKEASATQSATTASTKATEASSSATSALASRNASKTSETNASASEVLASKWANENEDVIVQGGKYSAKHYALKAEIYMNMSDAVKLTGNQTIAGIKTFSSNIVGSISGNSATATKLSTARTINGVSFDGTTNITVADSTKAPLISPALTGTPTSTTATDGTNTTQIATTAFVQNAVGGYLSKEVTGGTITLTAAEASNPVVAFSGALTSAVVIVVPTTTKRIWAIYNATSGAFTLTVKTAAGNGVTVAQGKRNLVYTDGTHVYYAFNDYESITLTGVSSAPTAAVGTNTTQLATTAFVNAEIANDAPTKTGSGASGTWGISISGNSATATKLATARTINGVSFDGSANITVEDSTAVKLTGNQTIAGIKTFSSSPIVPTPASSDNTTQVATTAYVKNISLGWGQTWQNVTASRSFGVTYTNSTGKPITISVFCLNTSFGTFGADINVNGTIVVSSGADGTAATGYSTSVTSVVPNGSTYIVTKVGDATQNTTWHELR